MSEVELGELHKGLHKQFCVIILESILFDILEQVSPTSHGVYRWPNLKVG